MVDNNDAYKIRSSRVTYGAKRPQIHADNAESYGQYLFGSGYKDQAEDPWTKQRDPDAQLAWYQHTPERLAVRLFSRGVLGAALYTAAHRSAPKQLYGYDHTRAWAEIDPSKPLQYVAKFFDTVYGKPITAAAKAIAPARNAEQAVERATWFRSHDMYGHPSGKAGRSLGHEITGMTFDFASGSIGDATGRELANAVDPRHKNSWEEEDGSINYGKMAQAVGRSTWKIMTKNQGEDWAAGLPYVYQMRFQRQFLNKLYPGFKTSSDRGLNGGSWRVDPQGRILESYSKAGALDLQLRFTGYNWYTLMFRDAYDSIGHAFKSFDPMDMVVDSKEFAEHPVESTVNAIGSTFRYVAKSAIKAFIYMTPAVPFFWVTRTPQTKPTGVGIYADGDFESRKLDSLSTVRNPNPRANAPDGASFKATDNNMMPGQNPTLYGKELPNSPFRHGFDPFAPEHSRGVLDKALNPIGKANYQAGQWLHRTANRMGVPVSEPFARTFANASFSYTPYMIAKAETALRWNNLLMDQAAYRLLDGMFSLDYGEVKGGLQDMREIIIHPPSNRTVEEAVQIKERQKQAEKQELRMKHGQDVVTNNDAKEEPIPDTHVTQVSEEKALAPKEEALRAEAEQQKSWSNKALMEKFEMDTLVPPGTSVH